MDTQSLSVYKLTGRYRCKVVEVYDGDTITLILFNKGSFEKHKLRMHGYDSPEMKPRKNIQNRESIIKKAKIARDALRNLILDKEVILEAMGSDKYGRLLGTIYKQSCGSTLNVNDYMLQNDYGYAYFGGTKKISSAKVT
tara:strand:- start:442 stop:861 length:420 start_codon:yes stop_codon:yes gene_type:complete